MKHLLHLKAIYERTLRVSKAIAIPEPPESLLDAETNLKCAGKYLRGAWLLSDGDIDTAISWYARGYYYEAKRRGMLVETGLRPA